ncbi:MAG TPA: hypothetical protein VJT73_21085 [Polyangiaceae bacterium]|nr:hypothetical protein [Polyangiaceae bacterium]
MSRTISFAAIPVAIGLSAAVVFVACGGSTPPPQATAQGGDRIRSVGDAGASDQTRCEYVGRADREAVETAGPGAVQPNVRRVYQMVGSGDTVHKVLICREIDTNLDGVKDVVRTYNEKGESLHEQADTNYDGRVDTWITFAGGRIGKEEQDSDVNGNADVWKYYVAGQLSRIQRDSNRDGRADRWEFYSNGKLERVGVDLDFDGHVDRWDHDELARLAAEASERTADQGAKSGAGVGDAGAGSSAPAQAVANGDLSVLSAADAGAASASKRKKK